MNNGITSKTVLVTPALARRWLEFSLNHPSYVNRALRPYLVTSYAHDMRAGHWRLTGEGVIFSADGVLLDGQHRLKAVIQSGCDVHMIVTSGVNDPEAVQVMGGGRPRTVADRLTFSGEYKNVRLVAASVRSLRALRVNVDPESPTGSRDSADADVSTVSGVRDYLAANPGFVEMVDAVPAAVSTAMLVSTVSALAYEVSLLESVDAALEFVRGLTGGIPVTDPRGYVRERLLQDRVRTVYSRQTATGRIQVLSLLACAWNVWVGGHRDGNRSIYLADRSPPIPVLLNKKQSEERPIRSINRATVRDLQNEPPVTRPPVTRPRKD